MRINKLLNENQFAVNKWAAGGWITPSGDYTETTIHVHDIIQDPTKFGFTSDFVADMYAKYNERMGSEGRAREELIKLSLQRGWIRFRRYKNYWSLTLHRLNKSTIENIKAWIRGMVKNGVMGKYDDLKILEVQTDDMLELEADEFLKRRSNVTEGVEFVARIAKFTTVAAQPDVELLNEVKMSRVYGHFTGPRPVAIITAFRGERTLEENTKLNRELAGTIRSAGFGFVWVDGAWIENKGTDSENHASEVSIMVIGDEGSDDSMFAMLVDAAKKYNQDGFVFKGSGKSQVKVYDKHGEVMVSFDRVSMDTISDMYTRLRSGGHAGRSFVFEGERLPVGYAGRLAGLKG